MKGKILRVSIALVLALSFGLVTAVPAAGATLEVGAGKTYTTIQAAIDAASMGDTITVDAGTYVESLTVDEEVSIIGAGPTTIIDPVSDADGITITANNVVIRDLKVSTENTVDPVSNIAISIKGTDGVEINTVTVLTTGDSAMGIWMGVTASSNLKILDCDITITDKGTAIYGAKIDGSPHSNWTITGNTLSAAHVPGVNLELYDVDTVLVDDNTFQTTGSVNLVYSSEYSNVGSATISNNVFEGSGDVGGVTPTIWVESDFQGAAWGDNTAVDGVAITGNTFNAWANAAIQIGEGVSGYDDVSNVTINSNIFNMTTAHPAILDFTDLATGTGNTFNVNSPATIQGAIDSAFAGETINIQAGTLSVTAVINVNVANLTISGASAATSIVDGSGKNASIVDGSDALFNVTADGVTIEDLTIDLGDDTTDFDVAIFTPNGGGIDDLTVQNSILLFAAYGNSLGEQLIHLGGGSGVAITGNTLETASSNSVIYVGEDVAGGDNDSLTVSNNTVAPVSDADGGGTFFNQFGPVTNSTISGNTLTKTGGGVYLGSGSLFAASNNITVTGNTFDSTTAWALIITSEVDGAAIGNITVTNNTFTDTAGKAIDIYDTGTTDDVDSSTITINYNNFAGDNTGGGVVVGTGVSGTVDAEKNWWGDVAGPTHTKNPYNTPTTGDAVSDDVDYLPWMIHTSLASGWNIYSTPIASGTSTDTISEALDLWVSDSTKVTAAYYFDASTPIWVVATSLTPLVPVYLNMSGAATIDVCYSTSNNAPPSMTMYQGWNLVGPAQLYDMDVDDALISALYGTGAANLVGYSQVVSPGIQQTATWTFIRGETPTEEVFIPTEGYWVFMVNQGMLGGFTYTPITP